MSLAREGVNVVICARNRDALEQTASDIRGIGGNVHTIAIDVTDPSAPKELVAQTVATFGGLDILVGNAGGPPLMRALEVNDEAIAIAVNANLTTSIRLVQESVPHMRKNQWGRIALITSRSIKQPMPGNSLSNLARTGLWGWAKTAAQDLIADGVTLNLVCPGAHTTDRMKDFGPRDEPMGDPADFGEIVAFACGRQTSFVTASAISVDGGSIQGLL
jgi:3-oxoacyl-[acyl-carrier protein] reductase